MHPHVLDDRLLRLLRSMFPQMAEDAMGLDQMCGVVRDLPHPEAKVDPLRDPDPVPVLLESGERLLR